MIVLTLIFQNRTYLTDSRLCNLITFTRIASIIKIYRINACSDNKMNGQVTCDLS